MIDKPMEVVENGIELPENKASRSKMSSKKSSKELNFEERYPEDEYSNTYIKNEKSLKFEPL